MKARFPSICLYCIGKKGQKSAIIVGQEIAPHPSVPGKWVHAWHVLKQVPLFK